MNEKSIFASSIEEDELSEVFDCCYRPKKSNSRKSMISLFTYLIIRDSLKPLSQREIIDTLSKYPYEICIERKALSRVIHGLEDSGLGITSTKKGVYYDQTLLWTT